MAKDSWYNSSFFSNIGQGLSIATVIVGIGFGVNQCNEGDAERIRARAGYELQEGDLNKNGLVDKFYVIDGNIAVVELDGKPIIGTLDNKVKENYDL
ncbi:hypothetical protein HOK51_08610 [Candidatus Woesearchaeota archaeon]|jgi:hypothetical protein|nr:hypothetical protein [Candidatus Woesearchaeota archaeon]MBT6519888.1 hypothetical protein [Candidatus Woesearchaeota archaeon]